MQVTLTQHAVGQGGFMSGLIKIDGGSFHWVYDCGSNQLDALQREIKIVSFQPIDVLFLSHLDSDHINGINDLCAATDVDEVVLPYLDDLDRLISAARADAEGKYRGNFANFLQDIPSWFKERGVKKITFINPRNDDDEDGLSPELPDRIDGDGEGEIKKKWNLGDGQSTLNDETDLPTNTILLDTSGAMLTTSGTRILNWVFSPYAHKPSKTKYEMFSEKIQKIMKKDESISELLMRFLSEEAVKQSIRNAYDDIWRDHNLVSMALYAGPIRQLWWKVEAFSGSHFLSRSFLSSVGWLSTGDFNLKRRRRRRKLLRHYEQSNLKDFIYVLQLPHHGSQRDFDAEILQNMGSAQICYASAGPNGYGHPSPLVANMVRSLSRNYFHVDHSVHSTLRFILKID